MQKLCVAFKTGRVAELPTPKPRKALPQRRTMMLVLQRAGEILLAPVAGLLERLLRWGWRVHLRQRAARARAPDVVLGDGILKLHLSDYRRRVLAGFSERLQALRSRLDGDKADAGSGSRAVRP